MKAIDNTIWVPQFQMIGSKTWLCQTGNFITAHATEQVR